MAKDDVRNNRVVIVGGSAGSLDVVLRIVKALPSDANALFIIVLHRKNDPDSILADLLSARTTMMVKEVEDKESIIANTVYIAPPDYHLLLENEQAFSLDSSEKLHYSRPSIDVTFESVAEIFGASAIGVLLSGANADGAKGLKKIKEAGGYTIVQSPETSEVSFMPQQAINLKVVDKIIDADKLPDAIADLLRL